jgi:hypothetical protein
MIDMMDYVFEQKGEEIISDFKGHEGDNQESKPGGGSFTDVSFDDI